MEYRRRKSRPFTTNEARLFDPFKGEPVRILSGRYYQGDIGHFHYAYECCLDGENLFVIWHENDPSKNFGYCTSDFKFLDSRIQLQFEKLIEAILKRTDEDYK